MTTKTLEKQVNELKREVKLLRSAFIGITGKDPEGDYRPDFIKRIKKAGLEKATYRYTGSGSLLKLIAKS